MDANTSVADANLKRITVPVHPGADVTKKSDYLDSLHGHLHLLPTLVIGFKHDIVLNGPPLRHIFPPAGHNDPANPPAGPGMMFAGMIFNPLFPQGAVGNRAFAAATMAFNEYNSRVYWIIRNGLPTSKCFLFDGNGKDVADGYALYRRVLTDLGDLRTRIDELTEEFNDIDFTTITANSWQTSFGKLCKIRSTLNELDGIAVEDTMGPDAFLMKLVRKIGVVMPHIEQQFDNPGTNMDLTTVVSMVDKEIARRLKQMKSSNSTAFASNFHQMWDDSSHAGGYRFDPYRYPESQSGPYKGKGQTSPKGKGGYKGKGYDSKGKGDRKGKGDWKGRNGYRRQYNDWGKGKGDWGKTRRFSTWNSNTPDLVASQAAVSQDVRFCANCESANRNSGEHNTNHCYFANGKMAHDAEGALERINQSRSDRAIQLRGMESQIYGSWDEEDHAWPEDDQWDSAYADHNNGFAVDQDTDVSSGYMISLEFGESRTVDVQDQTDAELSVSIPTVGLPHERVLRSAS